MEKGRRLDESSLEAAVQVAEKMPRIPGIVVLRDRSKVASSKILAEVQLEKVEWRAR